MDKINDSIYNTFAETFFVQKCIKEEYQDRILYDLQSKRKRQKAITKFSHSAGIILQNHFVKTTISEIQNYLFIKTNEKELCYIISDDNYDGKIVSVVEALEHLRKNYLTMILILKNSVIVKEESIENKIYFCQF